METSKHWNLIATLLVALLFSSSLNGEIAVEAAATRSLKLGFYASTPCKDVETVVRDEVVARSTTDRTLIPTLLRIYFHDCFADHQCDASLLIKKMPLGVPTELDAGANDGIRGLEFIDFLKTKVLASCGGANLVSCADIIALATRDAVSIASGGDPYKIPTGRLDGTVSIARNADSLPGPRQPIAAILARFEVAGFSPEETVILSGAHTIGEARCKFFNDRLYSFSTTRQPDRTMDPALTAELRKTCSNQPSDNNRVFLDQGTSSTIDKSYYSQIKKGRGVLQSDQSLLESNLTRSFVDGLAAATESAFLLKFEAALIRLGNLINLSGQGDIRKVCSVLN